MSEVITYESICAKLGFDLITHTWDEIIPAEIDDQPNPFDVLTLEELQFLKENNYFLK